MREPTRDRKPFMKERTCLDDRRIDVALAAFMRPQRAALCIVTLIVHVVVVFRIPLPA
jgi:hypothetical protein